MVNLVNKFELIDKRVYKLPTDGWQATHLATIKWGLREFIYFMIDATGQTYIEEVILRPSLRNNKVIAKYQLIEDDNLWEDLARFLQENNLTNMLNTLPT